MLKLDLRRITFVFLLIFALRPEFLKAQISAPSMNFLEQGETMGGAPALAVLYQTLYIAFRANDNSNVLWLDSSVDGVRTDGAHILGAGLPVVMGSDPSLAVLDGFLYVAFKSATSDNLFVCQIYDLRGGATYCTEQALHIVGTPSLVGYDDRLYVAYQKSPQYGSPSNQLGIAYAYPPSPSNFHTIVFDHYNSYNTLIGGPPAIAGYLWNLYVAFQAYDAGHNLFLQTFPLSLSSPPGPAIRYETRIGPTPALTLAGNQGTLMIAFEADDPYQHLWFQPLAGEYLAPAAQNGATISGAPAEVDWIPGSGPYAYQEIITAGFKSYDLSNHFWMGSQPALP